MTPEEIAEGLRANLRDANQLIDSLRVERDNVYDELARANAAIERLNQTEANWRREAQEARSSEAALQRELNQARQANAIDLQPICRARFVDGYLAARACELVAHVRHHSDSGLYEVMVEQAEVMADQWFARVERGT